ncbi:MAG: HAMP domain-containing histidine kinase [Chitinophagaceae bacterium]|nr:HAMP domain-containing histidine kinase [Chitinophagaceae bacterium]
MLKNSKIRIILSITLLLLLSVGNYYFQYGGINGLLYLCVIIIFSYQDDYPFLTSILFCVFVNILWGSGDLLSHRFNTNLTAILASSSRMIVSILASIGAHTYFLEKKQKETIVNQKTALEKSNLELNKFIAMAAHDIRTPVSSMKMISDFLVRDKSLSPESKQWVEIIRATATNTLLILNNTLNISQIRSGKIEMNFLKEDYIKFVKDNLLINSHFATTKKQEILFQSSIESIEAEFDKSRMVQVVNNLLSNAIKYSPENSSIAVSVECEEKGNGEQYITTHVKDQGLGIDEAFHDTLYNAFATTSNQPTHNEGKTGLGLAIVKKIVELHHGNIGFSSKKGFGSEFYFSIPISQNS